MLSHRVGLVLLAVAFGTLGDHVTVADLDVGAADATVAAITAEGGKALFFCVAGQNRSATLAIAVQLVGGKPLREV